MSLNDKLKFSEIVHQVADCLQAGGVLFDNRLRVLEMTAGAKKLLHSAESVDRVLGKGTGSSIRERWTDLIRASLLANQKAVFYKIPYRGPESRHLLDLICVPISSADKQNIGGVLIVRDVAESVDTANEIAQSDRVAAIARVAGKVAHELNNPLDGILRYINLSLRILEQGQPEKAIEYIQQSRTGLQRMARIIMEMLEFSRSSHITSENSPVDKLLDDALRAMSGCLKAVNVEIHRKDTGALPHVKGDALFQVFCNLIKNASDAMTGSGTLTITICRGKSDWRIEFQDTGPGFGTLSPEDIFKPFFTTKAPGRGTGLGLSICKDILEKLGGHIEAHNNPEGGACFRVILPGAKPPAGRS
jgi:C4-dicarboxylate-specific signal transduction histidine kinase